MFAVRSLLAAALLLVTPLVAVSPAAAATTCPPITFVGVHGLGEGPENSETINQTRLAYTTWAAAHGHPGATSFAVANYPRQSAWSFVVGRGHLIDAATRAVGTAVSQARQACPSTRFVLAGYSLGAWAIDNFLAGGAGQAAGRIDGIALYGDPWLFRGGDRGLARIWRGDAGSYPQFPAITRTVCVDHDPVCGAGYDTDAAAQALRVLLGGSTCGRGGVRPHLCYRTSAAQRGGTFLAEKAFS